MKELKFRAWDSRNDEMVYSDKDDCFYINKKGVIFMYTIPKSESGLQIIYHHSYTVMQSINLKDDEGKELYTGDIVCISGSGNCIVDISPIHGVTYTCIADDVLSTCAHDVIAEQENIFLIGNIHQNKGLLG